MTIEWLPYLGRVTTTFKGCYLFAGYWVTALFRQGYDKGEASEFDLGLIEWLPYLGRVTTPPLGNFLIKAWLSDCLI